jgi:capsule polysaccharide export protein KpsE/RkpR
MQSVDRKSSGVVDTDSAVEASRPSLTELGNEGTSLRLLWEHRRFLGRAVIFGIMFSTLVAFIIPKRYESTAQLMPPDKEPSAMAALATLASSSVPAGLGTLMGDLVGAKASSATFVGILQSRTVADHLINKFNLQKVYSARHIEDAREKLRSRTDISVDRKSGIVTVTVTDKDPSRSMQMAQAYVKELDELVARLATSAARREREFLEVRLQVVKRELEQSELEFSQFSSKNTTLDIKEQGKAMMEATAHVQAELIAVQTELEGLRQVYADGNVRVRAARARVNELKRKLNELGGPGPGAPASPSLPSSSDFSYPSIRQLPVLGVTYADLYRRTRIAEIVFELLTRQYEMAKVEEAKEIPSVKELDMPVVPQKKSFPPRLIVVLLGTLLAMSFAVTWIFGKQIWDHTEDDDPRKVFAAEIYQSIRGLLPRARWLAAVSNRLNGHGRGRDDTINGDSEYL